MLLIGLQDASDATLETLKAIEHPISKTAQILVEVCSFAGTGNVLKVQGMLHHCDEHIDMSKEKEKDKEKGKEAPSPTTDANKEEAKEESGPKDDTFQAFAVLGIALLAMGEDIGAEMSLRQFNHLVRAPCYKSTLSCLT
jgi:26S proteasome regulatory subunit N1